MIKPAFMLQTYFILVVFHEATNLAKTNCMATVDLELCLNSCSLSLIRLTKMDLKDGSQSSDDRMMAEMISAYLAQNGFSQTALRFAMEYAGSSDSPLGGSMPDHALEILLACGLAYFSLESADRANRPQLTDWETALREASNDASLYPLWNNMSFSSCPWDEQSRLSSDTEESPSCSLMKIEEENPDEEGNKDSQVLIEVENCGEKDDTEGGSCQAEREKDEQEEMESDNSEGDCDTDREEDYEEMEEDDYEEAKDSCVAIKYDYEEEQEENYGERGKDYTMEGEECYEAVEQ
ncbi:hypothetical protein M513_12175 [Trichuris suis]|uniref:Uncharacterized protein n=2 Tax=Trichuris suis TaxID=68888 RepID=A0A085LPN3_9BILA|nr:hypothetical protein M513_12175 [Trichuris suis]